MKNTLKFLAAIGLAAGLTQSSFATDYTFTGLANDGLWTSALNWDNGVPPIDAVNVNIAAANGWSTITIPAGADLWPTYIHATNGDHSANNTYGMLQGPNWGATLNIYGSVHYDWYLAPVQWDSTHPSIINMYTNSSVSGEGIALGYNWWYNAAPYVIMNMYDNAAVNINYFFWGGHLNLYGGTFTTGGVNDGNSDQVSDATRAINLAGGKLILPAGFTGTVNGWISRGIILVYGLPNDAADIVIDEANTNWPNQTVVYTSASAPNPILAVHIQVPRVNLSVGGLEQASVLADYAVTTGVNITATATNIVYYSSAPSVATITTNGMVRAKGVGTATLTAIVGSLSNSVVVTVGAYTKQATLIHRYSFSEDASSSTTADSVPGNSPTWDATLNGGATLGGGQVTLDGSSGYVQLPSGILTSDLDAVTIETWATLGTIGNWGVLYAFGDSDGNNGMYYISCQPHTANNTFQIGIADADPGNSHEQDAWANGVWDGYANVHVVAVYHPEAGYTAIYTNGLLAAINSSVTIPLTNALATVDPLNYLGRSLYSADPYFSVSYDEFRIYNGPLTQAQITASDEAGPNTVNINPGNLLDIHFNSAHTNLINNTAYPVAVFADYQFATNVPLANDSALVLTSSNTNSVQILGNQMQSGPIGTSTTLSATYQGKTASQSVSVIRQAAVLLHRWSFNETSGTVAHDSVGTANGTLQGSATFTGNGYVNLPNPGSNPQTGNSYVSIPGGLLNALSAVTVECWVTNNGWNNGNTLLGFSGPIDGNGFGTNYINFYSRMYSSISAFEIATLSGDSGLEALGTRVNDNGVASGVPSHYVYVYDPTTTHTVALYTNGVLAGTQSGVTVPLSSLGTTVGTIGLSVYNQLQSYVLPQNGGNKPNCPYINGGIDEVRIYQGVFTAADVAATQALGPDLTLGSSTAVSLSATTTASTLNLTWPTTAAPFVVLSSPTLGAGAVWTPVTAGLTVVGGNYKVSLPVTSSNQFFKLQQQ
jgi:hypothetical protein